MGLFNICFEVSFWSFVFCQYAAGQVSFTSSIMELSVKGMRFLLICKSRLQIRVQRLSIPAASSLQALFKNL